MARAGYGKPGGEGAAGGPWRGYGGVLETVVAQDACEQEVAGGDPVDRLVAEEEGNEIVYEDGHGSRGRPRESLSADSGGVGEEEKKAFEEMRRRVLAKKLVTLVIRNEFKSIKWVWNAVEELLEAEAAQSERAIEASKSSYIVSDQ